MRAADRTAQKSASAVVAPGSREEQRGGEPLSREISLQRVKSLDSPDDVFFFRSQGSGWHGRVRSLRDAAHARVFLCFFCRACGHHGRFKPEAMVQITRRDMNFEDLAPHLKCKNCGAFRAIVFSSDTIYPGRD